MKRQKLITISSQNIALIKSGDFTSFIKNMIKLGSSLLDLDEEIESIQGPFKSTEDEGLLIIVNIKDVT